MLADIEDVRDGGEELCSSERVHERCKHGQYHQETVKHGRQLYGGLTPRAGESLSEAKGWGFVGQQPYDMQHGDTNNGSKSTGGSLE